MTENENIDKEKGKLRVHCHYMVKYQDEAQDTCNITD